MLEFNPDPDILSSLYSLTWGVNYVTNILMLEIVLFIQIMKKFQICSPRLLDMLVHFSTIFKNVGLDAGTESGVELNWNSFLQNQFL